MDVGSLYDEAPCGLLLTAGDGAVLRANRTFCRWVGVDADALAGRRFQDLLTMGGRIFHQTHFVPLLQMQGSVSEVKLELVRADGERVPVVVNAVRRRDGEAIRDELAVFIAKDRHAYERELMLARKRAEELAARHLEAQEDLRRADRRKDEFLAMLAHELRNPLAPISTAAQLLRAAAHEPERLRSLAELIARQTAHLTELVDDLLDVSRVTRGLIQLDRDSVELAGIIDAAVEQSRPLVEARRHQLRTRVARGILVDGDRTRLVQVLVNLLNNAAKYTPPGGTIDVVLEQADGVASIHVTDTGLGIDATLLPHIFDLFSQAERTPDRTQGGLGIGLALVRSLVGLHGGSIEAHSEGAHRGSRFTVRLPCTVDAARRPEADAARASAVPVAAPLRILVVDDNTDAASTLAEVLALEGHATRIANTGAEALEHAAQERFDAFVLDIGLPDMTGYELASALRERDGAPALRIALTGYGQPHDRVLSRAAGFHHHLVKPVDMAQLAGILAAATRTQQRAPA